MFFHHRRFVWEISFSPQWKLFSKDPKSIKNNSSGILHKCIHVYIHILIFFARRAMRWEKICVTVVSSIALLLLTFIDISPVHRVLKNAFSQGISYPGKNVNKTQWNSVANSRGGTKTTAKCFSRKTHPNASKAEIIWSNWILKFSLIVLAQNRRLIQKLKLNCCFLCCFRAIFTRTFLRLSFASHKHEHWQKVWAA